MNRLPNILWIVLDALRWDHLSCYGYSRQTSPNIDHLAAQGALYKQAFAQAHYSLPSYATMFTGLYPHEHGVERSHRRIDESTTTLAEQLAAIGYETACISSNPYVSPDYGLSRGFDHYHFSNSLRGGGKRADRVLKSLGMADQGAARGVRFAQDLIPSCTQPWFLFILFSETHEPHAPPLGYITKYGTGIRHWLTHPLFVLRTPRLRRVAWYADEDEWRRVTALLDAEIAYVDHRIGQLVDSLADQGALDETIIIVAADHGDFLGEHGLGGHTFGMSEFLMHVPLVIRYPPSVAPGTGVDRIVELRDISYTLMQMIGATFETASAYSARNLLAASPADRHFAYARRRQADSGGKRAMAGEKWAQRFMKYDDDVEVLRTSKWQFRQYGTGRCALYDMALDPAETNEISAARPEIVEELQATLDQFLAQADHSRR